MDKILLIAICSASFSIGLWVIYCIIATHYTLLRIELLLKNNQQRSENLLAANQSSIEDVRLTLGRKIEKGAI